MDDKISGELEVFLVDFEQLVLKYLDSLPEHEADKFITEMVAHVHQIEQEED